MRRTTVKLDPEMSRLPEELPIVKSPRKYYKKLPNVNREDREVLIDSD